MHRRDGPDYAAHGIGRRRTTSGHDSARSLPVRNRLHHPAFMQLDNVPPCADVVCPFMYFIDSNGNDWTRTSTGLDERAPLPRTTMENPIGQGIGHIAVFEERVGEAGLCEGRGK
ncbi:hypothetical protein [Streptomyces phaeochromogenes]|uniref:hypothetical protein n=1 Tax=Streptomyces phaeochromogenes TaxID=1923 RepID=UPI00386A9DAF|nr:hypothetical protein OHB08_12245 [Streptomyces phaeochromogenes]